MGEQVLNAGVSADKSNSEYTDCRRNSLPAFSSNSGNDVPNYLRASIGSCHDFCKYGKETDMVRQNRPWIKNNSAESNVVLNKGVLKGNSAKVSREKSSNNQPFGICKSEILSDSKMSEDYLKSSEKQSKHFKDVLMSPESLTKKIGATSGSSKFEAHKIVATPANFGNLYSRRKSLNLQVGGKGNGNKSNAVNRSLAQPPMKFNTITRPPPSPSSKLGTKARIPSSSTPPSRTPNAKAIPYSSPKIAKCVGAHSSPSITTKKIMAKTPKTPRNMIIKKSLNFKDENVKKENASKLQENKAVATRLGSLPYKSKKVVDAETKEFFEKESSHEAELGNEKVMKSFDEVPEKTLYVIEMETKNIIEHENEDATFSRMLSQHKAPPCVEAETPTYTESDIDYFTNEDDHIKLKKSAAVSSQDLSEVPVKLTFRRGSVIEITQENDTPTRLKFRKENGLLENTTQDEVSRISFKMTETKQDNGATKNSLGAVVNLRHQDVNGKKDAQGLYNNVIEETASKLVEIRKSKVKALVSAFETLISLQDGKKTVTR